MKPNESTLCRRAHVPHVQWATSRRQFLASAGAGFGAVALNGMLTESLLAATTQTSVTGLHHPAKAKSVIFLFMEGGPSQLDTFDRKPLLNELAGHPLPASFKEPLTAMGERNAPLLPTKRKWARYGESGLEISDWFTHVARHADDLAVIRSCYGEGINQSLRRLQFDEHRQHSWRAPVSGRVGHLRLRNREQRFARVRGDERSKNRRY